MNSIFVQGDRLILVDANNLAYRCAYVPAFQEMCTKDGTNTGIVHGFMYSLLNFAKPNDYIIVAWDSRSHRKREVYPEYKAKRDNPDAIKKAIREDVAEQSKHIKKILHLADIDQYLCHGYEADEVIAGLALENNNVYAYYTNRVILSEDKDFLQLVNRDISVYQPIKKRMVHSGNFKKLYHNLTPAEYFFYRTLTGDKSDEIDGVPGVGEKIGLDMTKAHFNQTISKYEERIHKKNGSWNAIKKIINRNKELMKLNAHSITSSELSKGLHMGNPNGAERLERVLNNLELDKVLELWLDKTPELWMGK